MHTPINFSLESIQHFIRQNFRRTFKVEVPVQVTQHQTIIKICEQREKSANKSHPHEAKAALAIAVKAARESKKRESNFSPQSRFLPFNWNLFLQLDS